MAVSVNLRRPKQFPLHQMLWQDFEDLVRDIGFKLLGPSLGQFKPGPDGGRDARFDGTPNEWPNKSEPEKGQYVLQCKHTQKADACCSHEDFKKLMRKESQKVKKLAADKELSHYMVFTNRSKPVEVDVAFREKFKKIVGISNAWLLAQGEITTLLRGYPEVWEQYEQEVRNPLRFNREDLIEIIHDFSNFMKKADGQPRTESLRHLGLEDKNRINGISAAYFAEMQRHTMPQFGNIRLFLENPRNEKDLLLYRDTADDLSGRLRGMLAAKTLASLEEAMDQIRDEFIASDQRFKGTNASGNIEPEHTADPATVDAGTSSQSEGNTYRRFLCILFDMAVLKAYSKQSFFRFVYHDGILETMDDRKKVEMLQLLHEFSAETGVQCIFSVIESEMPIGSEGKRMELPADEIVRELSDVGANGRLFRMVSF